MERALLCKNCVEWGPGRMILQVRNPRGMIQIDHSAQARLLRVKAQGIDLGRGPLSTHGPLTSSPSLKGASPQRRAHAQSPGNPVRLLWLDKSHDVIQTRIHNEMSQPLCLTPTQFGNSEVLSHKGDAFSTSSYAAASLEICYAYNVVLHRSRRLIHNNIVLHLTKTPYILSLRMSRKERIHPLTPQPRVMANCRECRLDLT
jgi:hypothetical protein